MFIAKVTTDQERQMFSFDKNSAAILTFEELAQAGLSGAIMGSTLASIQMGVNRKKFTNTRLAAEEFYQKDFKDITQQDYQKFIDAISKDMNDPKNVKDVLNDLRNAQKAAQANAGEEAAPKTTTTGDQTDTVETPVEVTPDTTKTVVSETPADYSDTTKFITVEGNPIQQANIVEVNKRLHDFYVQRESAVKTNNQPMIKGIDMSIQQLRNIAKKTVDTPDYNHFKLKESDAPQATATTPQTTAAPATATTAPAPAPAPAATTATAQAAPTATATTTATAAQPVQQAPKGAVKTTTGTQKVVKKTRADYPTYYEWLLHQLDALKGRADKTQNPNEKRKLLGTRIPEMLAMIKAEEAAVAAGTTTEVTDVPKTTKGKGKVKSTAQSAPEPAPQSVPQPVPQQTPQAPEPVAPTAPTAQSQPKDTNANIAKNC